MEDRSEYRSEDGNVVVSWWSKDGYWHYAIPEFSKVSGKVELLNQEAEFEHRSEAIAAAERHHAKNVLHSGETTR